MGLTLRAAGWVVGTCAVARLGSFRISAFVATLLAGSLLLALTSPSLAHAELVFSSPSDGEELAEAPAEIRLVFSERPRPDSLSIRLFDRRGNELELEEPAIDPQLGTTVTVSISRELRPGPYTVVWSVVSEEDEHPVSRELVFGVEEPPAAPAITAAELAGTATGGAGLIARLLSLVGLLLLIGAAVQARWFGLPAIRMAYLAAAGCLLVAGGLVLNALTGPTARITTPGLLGPLDTTLLVGLSLASVALVAGLLAAGDGRPHGRALWLLVLATGAALAWLLAARSHASGVGILLWVGLAWEAVDLAIVRPQLYGLFPHVFELARQLNVLVAATHTLAISVWIGGLIAAGIAGMGPAETAAWHPRFSRLALLSFLVVAATGLYQAVLYLPSPSSLVETDYGLTLLGKHVFVVGVLALAGLNRFVIGPALRRGEASVLRTRAVAAVRGEAALGVLVVGAAVVLAGTSPARPPTDVFLAPEAMAELEQRRQAIGGNADWELLISRQGSTRHSFLVRGPQAPARPAALVLEGPGGSPIRDVQLAAADEGGIGEALALTRDGRWTASLTLQQEEVSFDFDVRAGHVLPHDAEAHRLWEQAISETEQRLGSARMIDVLTDGLSLMLFTHHELSAPDRARLVILGGSEMVFIGQQRFRRDGEGWEVDSLARPYRWPDYRFLERVMGRTVVGRATHADHEVTVLGGYDPETRVAYEIWVGRDDRLIRRVVMGVPGHYMINAYYDINVPQSIERPE